VAVADHLAHRAFLNYTTILSRGNTDRVNDREVKLQLRMGGKKLLNEALNKTLKLEAVNVEAGSPARLQDVRARAPKGTLSVAMGHHRTA
jgi:hypothetical protein